ncbi:MAG: 5'-methylthioadenosine/S-adenosylhomocysteine nucleosidase [Acholeplasmataceae bacterium]
MKLIVAAMVEEVAGFTTEPLETDTLIPLDFSESYLLVTGIGKVNAAASLARAIALHNVERIYNFGFVGATSPYAIHDLVVVEEASYHDFDLSLFGYAKGQVPGYPPVFPSDAVLLEEVYDRLKAIPTGRLYTGDIFMTDKRADAYLADMEGAALYQVARRYGIPIVAIKVVSDVIGSKDHNEQFQSFDAERGMQALKRSCIRILGG